MHLPPLVGWQGELDSDDLPVAVDAGKMAASSQGEALTQGQDSLQVLISDLHGHRTTLRTSHWLTDEAVGHTARKLARLAPTVFDGGAGGTEDVVNSVKIILAAHFVVPTDY